MSIETRLTHIKTYDKSIKITRDFDPYILCTIKFVQEIKETRYFWKIENPKQMIDIGISSNTGELVSMTIVLNKEPIQYIDHETEKVSNIKVGVPVFSLDLWQLKDPYNNNEYYSNNPGNFKISIEDNSIWIRLTTEPIKYYVGFSDVFLCAFNHKRNLCGFVIEHLTDLEKEQIHKFEDTWKGYQ